MILNFFLDKSIEYNEQSINNATNEIHNIFDKVAKLSLHRKSAHRTSTHKKWFDLDLAKMRKHLCERATLLSKFPNNPLLRGSFFKLNKEYAKLRKYKKQEFRQSIIDKLDQLNETNPKEYWNLVKSLRETDSNKINIENSIDGDTWSNYFTTLSKTPEKYKNRITTIESQINELLNSKTVNSFNKLDFRITALEIQKAITSLKSGKSPGLDNISNEMIKASQIFVNPCILKLFNIVLTSGIYPEKWLEGYTTPIFKSDNPKLPQNYRGITINNSIGKLFNIILNKRLNIHT